ncbi:amino acid ABC transporter substrate-binding protein [Sporosalibacterium faouarense]|uniref:amino acid ABC transporter substrate-binding protein n=1 Tax=Sporosalibacterium faouarense TaxID=516123 RepID=UPI00141D06DE|nr:amino acid ABC transporter substrate-binding protein [Sporosalibacterium faouarense]MTI49134.1 amino acid ABC transporter substrate-binding protein [Bacillota bacterium]
MKKNNLLFILTLFISITFIISACGKEEIVNGIGLDEIVEQGYVTIGLDDTFAPMGFRNEQGEIVGFDVDLAKEAFKRIGVEVRFQPIDWSMKEAELNSGNIDLIWNGYTITMEREEKVAFTKPYLENKQVIITLSDSNIVKKEDLIGKKVAVQSGSSSLDAVNKEQELVKQFKNGELILFETNNEAFMDLEAGRTDAVVADEILARYYIQKRGVKKYKILEEDFGKENYGIGLRKPDTELLEKLDQTLVELKNDGSAKLISEKWFGKNIIK